MGRTGKIKNPPIFSLTFICESCGDTYDNWDQFYGIIDDYFGRVYPGEPVPAGQCKCGGLVHIKQPNWENIVLKILGKPELLPILMHIDPELDELIAERIKT